jgi:hypothetical protein
LAALASVVGCTRANETSTPKPGGSAGSPVRDDLKDVGKATEKAAKDIGHAAGVGGEDAWITTKVKSELTSDGFDPLHVHVDTDGKVVTLSGTVESASEAHRAVRVAKAVSGVVDVKDHLFVKPADR